MILILTDEEVQTLDTALVYAIRDGSDDLSAKSMMIQERIRNGGRKKLEILNNPADKEPSNA